MMSLEGKVVLITEATSGVGAATARRLASLGCRLAVTGTSQDELTELGRECQSLGASDQQILLLAGDLTDDKNIEEVVKRTVDKFSALDILVCNLSWGGLQGGQSEALSATFDQAIRSNVRSVYYLTKVASPHLIQTKGCVVNNYGILSTTLSSEKVVYRICKSTLDFFVRTLAVDLASKGVRINSVIPGAVTDTRMGDISCRLQMEHPPGKHSKDQEVAAAIVYLASHDAAMITGELLVMDSGRSILPGTPKN